MTCCSNQLYRSTDQLLMKCMSVISACCPKLEKRYANTLRWCCLSTLGGLLFDSTWFDLVQTWVRLAPVGTSGYLYSTRAALLCVLDYLIHSMLLLGRGQHFPLEEFWACFNYDSGNHRIKHTVYAHTPQLHPTNPHAAQGLLNDQRLSTCGGVKRHQFNFGIGSQSNLPGCLYL